MTDDQKPEADVQEQQQPGPGNPTEADAPHDASEGDAQEQGAQRRPETEPREEGLPDEPAGDSLEERLDRATEERSGDEPA
jgi:hypothetical protein